MPAALNLFSFIGLLPGGVNEDELNKTWDDSQWMRLKDGLIRASLLVYKTDHSGRFVYSMLPFMSVRAYELLEVDEYLCHEYHMKGCRLFRDYCYEFYRSDKSIERIEKLIELETNIWAGVYRSLNIKKDIAYIKHQNSNSSSANDEEFASK